MEFEDFKRFLELNFYRPNIIESLFFSATYYSRWDLADFLIDNFHINFKLFPIYRGGCSREISYSLEMEYILTKAKHLIKTNKIIENNYIDHLIKVLNSVLFNDLLEWIATASQFYQFYQFYLNLINREFNKLYSTLDECFSFIIEKIYQKAEYAPDPTFDIHRDQLVEMLKNHLHQSVIKDRLSLFIKRNIEKGSFTLKSNIFDKSFIRGDIRACNIIKNSLPNKFSITKESITIAISRNFIHIVKYFFRKENCIGLNNSIECDIELKKHLLSTLSKHFDYKNDLFCGSSNGNNNDGSSDEVLSKKQKLK
ncbi:hypothetical protein ACTFIY_001514 [Dictyostelium cf. discoideum]